MLDEDLHAGMVRHDKTHPTHLCPWPKLELSITDWAVAAAKKSEIDDTGSFMTAMIETVSRIVAR